MTLQEVKQAQGYGYTCWWHHLSVSLLYEEGWYEVDITEVKDHGEDAEDNMVETHVHQSPDPYRGFSIHEFNLDHLSLDLPEYVKQSEIKR